MILAKPRNRSLTQKSVTFLEIGHIFDQRKNWNRISVISLSPPANSKTTKPNNQTATMSTITMPAAFDQAVKEMCAQSVDQAVKALAAKYGFDPEEAARELGEIKLERKRGPAPKAKSEKSPKKDKKAKEEKKPRAKTGYLLFADHVRDQVREEMLAELEEGEKLTGKAVVSKIAALWSEQEAETKEAWKERAAKLAAGELEEEEEEEEE